MFNFAENCISKSKIARIAVGCTVGLREQEGTAIRELSPFPFRGTTWEIVLWNE